MALASQTLGPPQRLGAVHGLGTPPVSVWWDDLPDSELRDRLMNRGTTYELAMWLVHHRDDDDIARRITMLVGR